jgi:hypothetical protein
LNCLSEGGATQRNTGGYVAKQSFEDSPFPSATWERGGRKEAAGLPLRLHYRLRSLVVVFLFGGSVGLGLFLRRLFVFGLR